MQPQAIAGWAYMLLVAIIATLISNAVVLGGKNPIEASAAAVVLGLLARNAKLVPAICFPGIKSSEKLLVLGIIFMGASLDFNKTFEHGLILISVIVLSMASGLVLIYALGALFKLPRNLSVLLAIGTSICGGTAVAISAPIIGAKDEEISYAVGTIALWGLAAILIYPALGRAFGASDYHFGVFAGTAIHSTPQVVGAGFIFSDEAGKIATAVKLVRNCFMAPLAFGLALLMRGRQNGSPSGSADLKRAFPWFLFGYFLMALCHTKGYFTPQGVAAFTEIGKFLVLLGMVGVGLNTVLEAFKQVGWAPLLVGLLGSVILAAQSAGLIALFI